MEIDDNYTISITFGDFLEYVSKRNYSSIDKNITFRVDICEIIYFRKADLLQQIISNVKKCGFKIFLKEMPCAEKSSFPIWAYFDIYWKSFKISYINSSWNYPSMSTSMNHKNRHGGTNYNLYESDYETPINIIPDLLEDIIHHFHVNAGILLLLMAIRKNKETSMCYIAQLPKELIRYIHKFVIEN